MYCLLHPYVVSYIIPLFMNKLFSYIQWMNFLICWNVVAAFWAESSEKCKRRSIFTFPRLLTSLWYLLWYSQVLPSIEKVRLKPNSSEWISVSNYTFNASAYSIFIIIALLSAKTYYLLIFFHSCLPNKQNNILWYA